jgi:serine/threonine-protein kinase
MTTPELAAGTQINANVRLVRLLGEGGMGSVWVADHLTLGTQVAVKFLSANLAKEQASIARFAHEATAAAQIKSQHVVQIFDHGVFDGGLPYMVMELLEGEDLNRRLERTGPMPVDELSRVVTQVCRALGKAHAVGIIHRDIKPDNIFLLDQDGELFVKVLDFGIAKRTNQAHSKVVTTTGAMVGTPYYMSPEQMFSSKHVDFRADLWSLGVVAYHCLTGHVPFEGETLGGLCVAIEKGVFDPPSKANPALPPAVDAWCLRALHRDPASRFSSAREMADALAEAARLPAGASGSLPASPSSSSSPAPSSSATPTPSPLLGPVEWQAKTMATPPTATGKTMSNFGLPPVPTPVPTEPRASQRRAMVKGMVAGGVLSLAAVFAAVSFTSRSTPKHPLVEPPNAPSLGAGGPDAATAAPPLSIAPNPTPAEVRSAAKPLAAASPATTTAPPGANAAPRPAASSRKPPPRPRFQAVPSASVGEPISSETGEPFNPLQPPKIAVPNSAAKPSSSGPPPPEPPPPDEANLSRPSPRTSAGVRHGRGRTRASATRSRRPAGARWYDVARCLAHRELRRAKCPPTSATSWGRPS